MCWVWAACRGRRLGAESACWGHPHDWKDLEDSCMCPSVSILTTEESWQNTVFENLEIVVNKNGDHQTRVLLPSHQLLSLSPALKWQQATLAWTATLSWKSSGVGSLLFEQKRNMQPDQHLSLAVIFYFGFLLVLGCVCLCVYFNLSLKLGNRIAMFSSILTKVSFILFWFLKEILSAVEGFDGLQWGYG